MPRAGGLPTHSSRDGAPRDTLLAARLDAAPAPRSLLRSVLSAPGRLVAPFLAPFASTALAQSRRTRAAWHDLRALLLEECLQSVQAAWPELRPVPRDGNLVTLFASLDDTLNGRVATLKGGPIAHAVTAEMWSDSGGFGAMRLDAFADVSNAVPHLMLHLNVLPGTILFFFDLVPRVDLKMNDAYLTRNYLLPAPGCARALSDLVASCLNDSSLTPYISRDGVVRTFMASPSALLFTVPADAKGVQRIRSIAQEMIAAWIALAKAPLGPRVDAATLRTRDAVTRRFVYRDPDTANMRLVLGRETTDKLCQLLAGM